jgi:hypothetical protein
VSGCARKESGVGLSVGRLGNWFPNFKIGNQFTMVNEGFFGQRKMISV